MTRTVLILGASGKIGTHAAEAFWNAGWTVRCYTRGTDMTKAAQGCDVIVNGLNPPNYKNWAENIPRITKQVIAAAQASGATVILPGNVYNFGDVGGVWSENTPQNPCSRKGHIRVMMEESYRASGVQTIVLRAGNFIDPHHNGDVMSLVAMTSIAKGKLTIAGDPSVMQAYAYLPDWALAAVMLAEKRSDFGQFEDIPFEGHSFTMLDLKAEMERTLNRKIKLSGFPWIVMRIASPFWELARELMEMRYLWNTDHQLSGDKLRHLLPDLRPTDIRTVMRAGLPEDIHPDKAVRTGGAVAV